MAKGMPAGWRRGPAPVSSPIPRRPTADPYGKAPQPLDASACLNLTPLIRVPREGEGWQGLAPHRGDDAETDAAPPHRGRRGHPGDTRPFHLSVGPGRIPLEADPYRRALSGRGPARRAGPRPR